MVKATYKNNLEEYKKYFTHTIFNLNGGKKTLIILGSIVLALVGISFLFPILFVLAILFAIVFLFKVLGYRGGINKHLKTIEKNYKEFEKNSNEYEFYEENFFVINKKGKTEAKYEDLIRVEETKEFFYLYVTKVLAYIIKKSGIQEGSSEELSLILKNAVKEKYKRRGK